MADLENNIGNEQTIKKYKADKECVYNCVIFLRCTISVFFPCRRYLPEKTKGGVMSFCSSTTGELYIAIKNLQLCADSPGHGLV